MRRWPPCSAQSRGPRRGWGGRSWRRRSPAPCPPRRRRPKRSPRPRRPARCCCSHAVDHLRAARPQAYHRVHAHVLLALGPGGVHALQRAPQRRRVHGSAQRCPTRCGPSGRRPGPALRPAKRSGSRAPRTATDSSRTASRRNSPPQSPVRQQLLPRQVLRVPVPVIRGRRRSGRNAGAQGLCCR